jgi:phosphomannomutase
MIATDMLYFAVARDGLDGGVQITASHNPEAVQRHEDGAQGGVPLSGDEGLGEIREMIAGDALPPAAHARHGDDEGRRSSRTSST